jgi:putative transposase
MNTPLARFQEGILGTDTQPGIGLPERFTDEARLRLDFMPFKERTVQEYGVLIDHIYYNDDVLRTRIHEMDPEDPKSARKFIFRRDPADISVIYFWDPDLKVYREIPTAFRGRPPAALWEVRTVMRELKAKGMANVNENLIYEGIDEMREIERGAAEKTKTARRNEQRRLESERARKAKRPTPLPKSEFTEKVQAIADDRPISSVNPCPPVPESKVKQTPALASLIDDDEEVLPFEDVDMRS